ncbi:hypothetical protein [Achromobacter sp. ACRQX]|uniref:hypothetical protein n=1 Tax=Achromobacter sp. ACRQX TaxID=2918181 RepID=UPI001EF35EB4|nr:hypothetical protein [Achromobacter sp. ACRQX]MCG7328232.1 hypothetical protein [Achromobacter sp. ACRQX]
MDTTQAGSFSAPLTLEVDSHFQQLYGAVKPLLDTKKIRIRFGRQGDIQISYNGSCGKPTWRAVIDTLAGASFRAIFVFACMVPFGAVLALAFDLAPTTSVVGILGLSVVAGIASAIIARQSPNSIVVGSHAVRYGESPMARLAYTDIVRLYVDGIGVKAETWPRGKEFDAMRTAPITLVSSPDPEVRWRIFHAIDAAWSDARKV